MEFLLIFYALVHLCFLNAKTCRRNTSIGVEYYCCGNFEIKRDRSGCQECRTGFTSDNGNDCRPCKQIYYGDKCAYMCNCSDNNICDNVHGCMTRTETFEPTESGTTIVSKTLQKTFTDGITQVKLIIYIAITGVSAVSIGLCIICKKRRTKIQNSFKKRCDVSPLRTITLESVDERAPQSSDNIYDILDEQNMLNDAD
ncbi:unnamed protein product [Mytilus coruscus]|uniref:MEGF10_11 n=1 Tax=Mytilus coruscus TaxID=42192 RepID=A0A6J8AYD7_MYTCO|nr:unnamed protein product [Mytilus coruscus]